MKGFNNLLFVVENHRGSSERNVLYTKDEFLSHLKKLNCNAFAEDIQFLLSNQKTAFQWKSLTLEGATLDFRMCRDERDLQDFLRGAYNDSVDKMAARGLTPAASGDGFHWENAVHAFSPRARYLCSMYIQGIEQRPPAQERGYVPLDERILLCQQEKDIRSFKKGKEELETPKPFSIR